MKQTKREDCTKLVSLRVWGSPLLNFACHLEVLSLLWQDGVTAWSIAHPSAVPLPLSLVLLCGNLLTSVGVDQLLWAVIISQGMKCNSWGSVSHIQYESFRINLMDEEIQSVELPVAIYKQPTDGKIRASVVWDVRRGKLVQVLLVTSKALNLGLKWDWLVDELSLSSWPQQHFLSHGR